MIKKLLIQVFEKAEEQTGNKTPNGQASHLAHVISEEYDTSITQRSMMRYYDNESTPKVELLNALSKYLGYKNYEDYVTKHDSLEKGNRKTFIKVILIVLGLASLIIITSVGFHKKSQNCMMWSEDHYKKVDCGKSGKSLILLDQNLLENFKKVQLDTSMTFFERGKTKYWYDKTNGKIEFFNMDGFHPVNEKKLKPITQTIVRKYIYNEKLKTIQNKSF